MAKSTNDVDALLKELRSTEDPAEKSKIRGKLRRAGHYGGLGGGQGRPAKSSSKEKSVALKTAGEKKKTTRKKKTTSKERSAASSAE